MLGRKGLRIAFEEDLSFRQEEHAIAAAQAGIRDIVAAGGSAELASDPASSL